MLNLLPVTAAKSTQTAECIANNPVHMEQRVGEGSLQGKHVSHQVVAAQPRSALV